MSKRNLYKELQFALSDAKKHDEGKLTLKTHKVNHPVELTITPREIRETRTRHTMSRQIFAKYMHISNRTLENWEQGRSRPNEQAITLLHLVKNHPETLSHIAALTS